MTILVILLGSIICYFVSQSRKDSSHNLSDVSVVEATVLAQKSNYLTVALKKTIRNIRILFRWRLTAIPNC